MGRQQWCAVLTRTLHPQVGRSISRPLDRRSATVVALSLFQRSARAIVCNLAGESFITAIQDYGGGLGCGGVLAALAGAELPPEWDLEGHRIRAGRGPRLPGGREIHLSPGRTWSEVYAGFGSGLSARAWAVTCILLLRASGLVRVHDLAELSAWVDSSLVAVARLLGGDTNLIWAGEYLTATARPSIVLRLSNAGSSSTAARLSGEAAHAAPTGSKSGMGARRLARDGDATMAFGPQQSGSTEFLCSQGVQHDNGHS